MPDSFIHKLNESAVSVNRKDFLVLDILDAANYSYNTKKVSFETFITTLSSEINNLYLKINDNNSALYVNNNTFSVRVTSNFTQNINLNNFNIRNLADPISSKDAVNLDYLIYSIRNNNKDYVDYSDYLLSAAISSLSSNTDKRSLDFIELKGGTLSSTTQGGSGLNFNNTSITKFTTKVKNITIPTPSNVYYVTEDDCGCVLYVNCTTSGKISIPRDLPVGYNLLIINNSLNNILIGTDDVIVSVRNIYDYVNLGLQFATCNLLIAAPNVVVISGDLS